MEAADYNEVPDDPDPIEFSAGLVRKAMELRMKAGYFGKIFVEIDIRDGKWFETNLGTGQSFRAKKN